jgi:hypothetical protein
MTDFLAAMVGRTLGADGAVRPRGASRFERPPVEAGAKRGRGGAGTSAGVGARGRAAGDTRDRAATGGRAAVTARGPADPRDAGGRAHALPPEAASPTAAAPAPPRVRPAAYASEGPPARAGSREGAGPSDGAALSEGAHPSGGAPRSAAARVGAPWGPLRGAGATPLGPFRGPGAAPERPAPDPSVEIARPEAAAPPEQGAATVSTHPSGSRRDPGPAPPPSRPSEAAPARGDAPAAPVLVEPRVLDPDREVRRATTEGRPVQPDLAQDSDATEPVVHVHIGRIEVRAPARPEPPRRAPQPREPLLSLDEYLRQTAGGRR